MEELRALREIAKANGQLSAAIRAEELRGKLRGFYVDQVQHRDAHGFEQMTDEQLRDYIIREAAGLGLTIKPTNGVGKQPNQGAKTLRDLAATRKEPRHHSIALLGQMKFRSMRIQDDFRCSWFWC